MNRYEKAFDVIETILHLMCGEEREDVYRPSHDEMVNSMEDFKELVEKSIPKKAIKVSEAERIKRAGYTHKCPICGSSVGTITRSSRIEPNNYCCFCGQRLQWQEDIKDE